MTDAAPLFFLVAGESSGDLLGARLMQALRKRTDGHVRFAGVGGPRMVTEGIDLLFPQSDLAHMGLFELVRHLPLLLRRIRQTIEAIKTSRPAALITIDSPDFSFRVAKKLKGQGIPLIHYVAPTVWAWRPGRAKKIARFLDHLLTLLPFEPPYFTKAGLACTFVGHPLVEGGAGQGVAVRFRDKFKVGDSVPLLAILPGSRIGEVKRLLPIFKETLMQVYAQFPGLHIVVPTVPHLDTYVRDEIKKWPIPAHFVDNDADKYDAFAACSAALACSGTVSVELALAALPTVIAYKIGTLTAMLYRRLIKTRYATLVNIMQNKEIMPEFLQEKCTPEHLAPALLDLLLNRKKYDERVKELTSIGEWLGRGQFIPSDRAADTVWRVVSFPSQK
ncbi:MAG: lipid-A-disaccharide synthase [Alphaproteobacteria bacterium]|nr:lipid-A-disaccharide synthase [Alphaproteobacteria bacterium]